MGGKRLRGQGLRSSRQARHPFSPCQWASSSLWVLLLKLPWFRLLTGSSKFLWVLFLRSPQQRGLLLHVNSALWEVVSGCSYGCIRWQGGCGGEQPGGCICWLAVGALQCGKLWVKEEVARLLQAKSRPGIEPILLPHVCQSSACAQSVLKDTKKWYHGSLLTRSDGCISRVLYYCVASFFLGRLNTHICSPHTMNS